MIEELVKKNQELIKKYENNQRKLANQIMISKFLKHKRCFFDFSMEDSYNILKDLEVENIEETYIKLISYNNYIKP